MQKILLSLLAAVLVGCAQPHVVESVKKDDYNLTCKQLTQEFESMDKFIKEANDTKGVTAGNFARFLVFPLAIVGTYSNANEAINAAQQRKMHLMNIMHGKRCKGY